MDWVGRDHQPYVLAALHASVGLHPRRALELVPAAWCAVEHPFKALDRDTWRDLFELAGYTHDGRRRGRPRKVRTLSPRRRQVAPGRVVVDRSARGSRLFADRPCHPEPGQVWVVQVEPHRLLARITTQRPGESEYVVDTEGLTISAWAPT